MENLLSPRSPIGKQKAVDDRHRSLPNGPSSLPEADELRPLRTDAPDRRSVPSAPPGTFLEDLHAHRSEDGLLGELDVDHGAVPGGTNERVGRNDARFSDRTPGLQQLENKTNQKSSENIDFAHFQ